MDVDDAFAAVQARLLPAWRADGPGSTTERTIISLPSYSLDPVFLSHYAERIPALEQRFLFVTLLLRDPRRRVVYLSCTRPPEYVVRYYLRLLPEADRAGARSRLALLSADEPSAEPLTWKLLARPALLEALSAQTEGRPAYIEPWNVTAAERELAVRVGLPLYGAHPRLWGLATKRGGRRLFAEEGIAHPAGEDVATVADLVGAIARLRAARPGLWAAVVKLDDSGAGDGNSVIDTTGLPPPGSTNEAVAITDRLMALPGWYVDKLRAGGGIVEERIQGADFRSPSAQLAVTPAGHVDVVSTHDQVLGGHSGQVYQGARFPADPAYAPAIAEEAVKVGRRLAREGVIGRFSVDFVAVPAPAGGWDTYAIEINLRKGGTTHPYATARLLTRGLYDATSAYFSLPDGALRWYVASDNLVDASWQRVPPEDLIAAVAAAGLAWDDARRTGVVLHMLACLPVDGRFGLTAIGESPERAQGLYDGVAEVMARLASGHDPRVARRSRR